MAKNQTVRLKPSLIQADKGTIGKPVVSYVKKEAFSLSSFAPSPGLIRSSIYKSINFMMPASGFYNFVQKQCCVLLLCRHICCGFVFSQTLDVDPRGDCRASSCGPPIQMRRHGSGLIKHITVWFFGAQLASYYISRATDMHSRMCILVAR